MKRLVSLFLSFTLILALVPSAFAVSSPPYSLPYVKGITGVRYKNYSATENLVSEKFTVSQRTLEMYDVIELWLSQNASWSEMIQPFRNAFKSAGFNESVELDKYGQEEYSYDMQNDSTNIIETFIIKSETASHVILNEGALVFIEHGYITLSSPQGTNAQTPTGPTSSNANSTITAQQAAQALYEKGLFSGTGTDANGNPNFDLDRAPTRHEAVTMLVRLLGKASEAENGTWSTPFTDVANWAKPYVGYAYTNGLTSGTSSTTYSGNQIVTASQYLTFILRALGYEVGTDFQWDKAWELSDKIGLTDGQYNANTADFTRGDVAIISYNALTAQYIGGNLTLQQALLTALPPIIKNNIPDDARTSLKAAVVKTQISYRVIIKCVNDASSAGTTSEWAGRLAEAFQWTGNFRDYLSEVCQLCGDYDDTQELKMRATKLYNAILAIPTAPSSAEGVFTETQLEYVKQVIAVFANQSALWDDYNNAAIRFSGTDENA